MRAGLEKKAGGRGGGPRAPVAWFSIYFEKMECFNNFSLGSQAVLAIECSVIILKAEKKFDQNPLFQKCCAQEPKTSCSAFDQL